MTSSPGISASVSCVVPFSHSDGKPPRQQLLGRLCVSLSFRGQHLGPLEVTMEETEGVRNLVTQPIAWNRESGPVGLARQPPLQNQRFLLALSYVRDFTKVFPERLKAFNSHSFSLKQGCLAICGDSGSLSVPPSLLLPVHGRPSAPGSAHPAGTWAALVGSDAGEQPPGQAWRESV